MRILISGATGYIGYRLLSFLIQTDHEIITYSRKKIDSSISSFMKLKNMIHGDINNPIVIDKIANLRPEIVIHLISLDHHDSENCPDEVIKSNVLPTWNLLYNLKSKGLKKFIYFSTIHVYSKHSLNHSINEKDEVNPHNSYGLTHYISENICNYFSNIIDDFKSINIRLANSYGEPYLSNKKCWNLIVNDLVRSAYFEKKIILKSDGKAERDFIHYSDICSGVLKLIELKNIDVENLIINFCSGKTITILELAFIVRKVLKERFNVDLPVFINSTELVETLPNNDSFNRVYSTDIANSLGIRFEYKIEEGIFRLYNYLNKNNLNEI